MTTTAAPAQGLTLIGAGAGSGKTYQLTEVVTKAVDPKRDDCVPLEGLVAVTYTRKAAAELAARIRRKFIEAGDYESAQSLPLAHVGTVHAVCLRVIQEFALDAGVSPQVDVVPGSEAKLLRQALEQGLTPTFRAELERLAQALKIRLDSKNDRVDWMTPVQDIMTLARSNRVAPSALPAMAERSAARLLELMGLPEPDGDAMDRDLLAALEQTAKALDQIDDGRSNTEGARNEVRSALHDAKKGPLSWSAWVKLQKLAPGVAGRDAVVPVIAAASRVDRHPRLHAEIRSFTHAAYNAAREGLGAYDEWKKRRRAVDFVDMIDRALTLVEHPGVKHELAERLELLVVDEFQDTSPVQLALFVRLHQLAGRSTWVGDRKQCIFEYAGADPVLMDAVAEWARREGGATTPLLDNWRSRSELVEACSRLFEASFALHGYKPGEVAMTSKRPPTPGFESLPPFGLWLLEASNKADDAEAIAEGVRRLLEKPAETRVADRATRQLRDLRPSDVAVLVATNAEAELLTVALAQRGVRAAIARAGLLATPEGTLVDAALRVVLDGRDSLAMAIIEALTAYAGQSPEGWLGSLIRADTERRGARERGEQPADPVRSEIVTRLLAIQPELDGLSPSEALDRVLALLDMPSLCARWPDPEQRLSNLDALRALTAGYEETCSQRREAGTVAGLLRYFAEAAEKVIVRDEEIASDDQHAGGGTHTVTVATYHKSKGLEWPVVVLGSLDRSGDRRDVFEVSPETDRGAFDASDPLGGRWIRYFPWPYEPQKKTRLTDVATASPEGVAVQEREERERVRLLYVGFTRARDHLVLAVRRGKKGPKAAWLDELCDAKGKPLLVLPMDADEHELANIGVRGIDGTTASVATRLWSLGTGGDEPARLPGVESHRWFAQSAASPERPTYWVAPSRAAVEWPELGALDIGEPEVVGARLPLGSAKGVTWDLVGDALHRFLAADLPGLSAEQRRLRAERLLSAAGLLALLDADALLRSGDNLRKWAESRWPGATWHREVPVSGALATTFGARRIEGTIDLLLETADGVVIIDHKSYPGAQRTWCDKAKEFAPQLAAYAEVLRMAEKRVLEQWVSFTVAGGAVRVGRS